MMNEINKVNDDLEVFLSKLFLDLDSAQNAIHMVLTNYGLVLPRLNFKESDEFLFEIRDNENNYTGYYLYITYDKLNEGYDFYANVVDEDELTYLGVDEDDFDDDEISDSAAPVYGTSSFLRQARRSSDD